MIFLLDLYQSDVYAFSMMVILNFLAAAYIYNTPFLTSSMAAFISSCSFQLGLEVFYIVIK